MIYLFTWVLTFKSTCVFICHILLCKDRYEVNSRPFLRLSWKKIMGFECNEQHKVESFLALARTNLFLPLFTGWHRANFNLDFYEEKTKTWQQKPKTPSGADGDVLKWISLCNSNIIALVNPGSIHLSLIYKSLLMTFRMHWGSGPKLFYKWGSQRSNIPTWASTVTMVIMVII